ncbi:MAG TPA: CrcB family protein [Candidatus Limnocylindrales bacterium]|nr:CrcB family protein [Candidatus Limnocylindrales bacterium]
MGLLEALLIGGGGFLGSICRYLVDGRLVSLTGRALPWGTFSINVSGSVLLGVLFALLTERSLLPAALVEPVMLGFIGAYTTFSTLMLESWRLAQRGAWRGALLNLGGSMLIGLAAVLAGLVLGRALP